MAIKEITDFIFENYYEQREFSEKHSYYSMNCQKKNSR